MGRPARHLRRWRNVSTRPKQQSAQRLPSGKKIRNRYSSRLGCRYASSMR
jgi:hypothetical protein